MVGTQQQSSSAAPIQNRRANAFSDIFGRPPVSTSNSTLQHSPSYRSSSSSQIRNSPNPDLNNHNNNYNHNPQSNHPSQYQNYYQSQQQAQQLGGQRSTSGGSYRDSDFTSGGQRYQDEQNYANNNYQQQHQQQQQDYGVSGGNGNYRQFGSISNSNQYTSPNSYQGEWNQQQQLPQLTSDQHRSSFSSQSSQPYPQSQSYAEDYNQSEYPSPDLAGRQLQHQYQQQQIQSNNNNHNNNSPQSNNYAPTLASGPSSASTSNSNTTSPSINNAYLPSNQNLNSNLNSLTSSSIYSSSTNPTSTTTSLPPSLPVLPEFLPTDDFYGFESSRSPTIDEEVDGLSSIYGNLAVQPAGARGMNTRRDSGGSVLTTHSTINETDIFDSYSAYPSYQHEGIQPYERSRRDSGDSDATSLYRNTPPSFDQRPLLALNPSVVSLGTYANQPSGASSIYNNNYNQNQTTSPSHLSRRSSESVRMMSKSNSMSSGSTMGNQDRSYSFTNNSEFRTSPTTSIQGPNTFNSRPYPSGSNNLTPSSSSIISNSTITTNATSTTLVNPVQPLRAPVVYPALLSRVAEAFKTRIVLTERVKDGLVYSETFDGRDAVDKIAYIIKTTDRNLALLLGRALDAQKFFHDVTYDHRLRDSAGELYQFKERLSILSQEELSPNPENGGVPAVPNQPPGSTNRPPATSNINNAVGSAITQRRKSTTDTILEETLPSGVFTLLTDCYSPTCTRDRLCYSIACPRRLEQQARLNLKPKPGLKRSLSSESLGDLREPGSLWIHSVPQEIADSTSDSEKKRQEALNEVFYTERDFVRDMEYLRDSWIKPLQTQNIIPEARREDFITQVFWNVLDIYAVNVRLAELLNKRQKTAHVVEKVGDIFLEIVPHFGPFVKYGAHQLYGKYEFEKEKGSNPAFAKFVDDTERLPESRKLELNGYLTKPTTRLARYPLLLEACLKNTPDDNPDKIMLPKVVKLVREFLNSVNIETGRSENRFNLAQLDQQLVFKNGEAVDLRLRDEDREMIFKGPLKKRGGTQSESAELQVFLFDHAVLMVKQKAKNEQYKVYRKPIPLELLVVVPMDDPTSVRAGSVRPRSLMSRGANARYLANPPPGVDKNSKQGFAMTFVHLGRRGYQITLWSSSWAGRKKWLEKIEARQSELRERSLIFETLPLSAGYFVGTNRVTCAAPFDNGNRMVYGTDNGVYLSNLNQKNKVPVKVISVPNVTQLDVLEEQGILIVLADKAVQTFFVDNLDPGDAVGAAKRARKISSHATFFKAGQCLGRTLVCVVKSGSVSSTIKTLEPIDQVRGKKQPAIRKFLQGSSESLRVFKEFYIPTESSSVHFLKSKLCVGCTKGFEIVDLETLDTQGLLDPADSSLDFVQKRENARPIAIYRIEGDFLLCYDEFAFYVNKNGWRAKSNWIIQWEGFPTHFALHYPYVLAFEPTFVEVRHVESGALMQIISGNNLKCLFADSPPSASSSNPGSQFYPSQQNSQYGYGQQPQQQQHSNQLRTEIILSDGDRIYSLQCV